MLHFINYENGSKSIGYKYMKHTSLEKLGPGQVVKLPTSGRLAALLRAAGHRGLCVIGGILSGWDLLVCSRRPAAPV